MLQKILIKRDKEARRMTDNKLITDRGTRLNLTQKILNKMSHYGHLL